MPLVRCATMRTHEGIVLLRCRRKKTKTYRAQQNGFNNMGEIVVMTPTLASSGNYSTALYCVVAAFIGLGVAFVFGSPKDTKEAMRLLVLSLAGLLLLAIGIGAVNTWASKPWQRFVSQPVTVAGLVGLSVACGSFIWGAVRETAEDARGLNIFELMGWIKSGGKLPRRKKP